MGLNANTKIDDLLKEYPFLMEFLIARSSKFKLLENPIMRKTMGKVATLSQAASVGGIEINALLADIAAEIKKRTGKVVAIGSVKAESAPVMDADARQELLKDIIRDLHQGVEMSVLKRRFHELIKDIDPSEIAKMEQRLMADGMPESEVKRLCDVHVEVFKESLSAQEAPVVPPGHPLHTYMLENRAVMKRVFPELFEHYTIMPVDDYPSQLFDMLAAVSPRPARYPAVVVLTPGIYNSAYFEHTFLAREMGVELAEGRDLVVKNTSPT